MKRFVAAVAPWLIWTVLIGSFITYSFVSNRPTCTTETVPYSVQTINDDTMDIGTTKVSSQGTNGSDKVCRDKQGAEVSRSHLTTPINEVDAIGTKTEPTTVYVPPATTYSGGTLCADGTYSSSTGRGTCSWHGGEAY